MDITLSTGNNITANTGTEESADLTTIRKSLKASSKYDISIKYEDGLVKEITINGL